MKAVADIIIAEIIVEKLSKGGIIVPGGIEKDLPQKTGLVLTVGPDVVGIKEGDRILFHTSGGQVIKLGKTIYKALKASEIYCIIEKGE